MNWKITIVYNKDGIEITDTHEANSLDDLGKKEWDSIPEVDVLDVHIKHLSALK